MCRPGFSFRVSLGFLEDSGFRVQDLGFRDDDADDDYVDVDVVAVVVVVVVVVDDDDDDDYDHDHRSRNEGVNFRHPSL